MEFLIFFHAKCASIKWKENVTEFIILKTGISTEVNSDILFGADGAFSAARLQHQLYHDIV
jgi:kynurenine 3-monooxygenase